MPTLKGESVGHKISVDKIAQLSLVRPSLLLLLLLRNQLAGRSHLLQVGGHGRNNLRLNKPQDQAAVPARGRTATGVSEPFDEGSSLSSIESPPGGDDGRSYASNGTKKGEFVG